MKRIIIPVENNKLSEYFNKSSHYLVVEIYKEHISKKKYRSTEIKKNGDLINWLISVEASDIIAHIIDNEIIKALMNTKVSLFVGININTPDSLIESYLNGNLRSDLQVIKSQKTLKYT